VLKLKYTKFLQQQICLFSPQYYFKEKSRSSSQVDHEFAMLNLHDSAKLKFPYNPSRKLQLMSLEDTFSAGLSFEDFSIISS